MIDALERGGGRLLSVVAVAMSLFHLATVDYRFVGFETKYILHVAFAIVLIGWSRGFVLRPGPDRVRIDALLAGVVVLVATAYALRFFYEAAENPVRRPPHELLLSVLLILLLLALCQRLDGWALVIVIATFFLYALFSDYVPGPFGQRALPWQRLASRLYLTQEGIYGSITAVSATFVFIFILFGAFLEQSGGGEYYSRVAQAIFGTARGGAAKVAVAASACFAMLSGSALANAASTGQITIPMMRRAGYRREFAGAVEAVASIGGEVTPPVMAGSVFVMIALLGITYGTVARAAALISVLFYVSVFLSVHAEACKQGLRGMPREEVPPLWPTLKEGWYYFLPLVLVLGLLIGWDYPAERAGLLGVLSIPVVLLPTRHRMTFRRMIAALRGGAMLGASIGVLIIAAQMIASLINFTGLGLTFSERLIGLAGEELVPLVILCFLATQILGLPLPAVTTYIILAAMVAPAMVKAGANPLAAHMFILYGAMTAVITPPVAPAAMLTAGIAEANYLKTSWEAMRLAVSKFILPFMFVFNPALLLDGDLRDIVWATFRAAIVVVASVVAVQGWGLRAATWLERVLFGVGCVLLISPAVLVDMAGLGVIGLATALHAMRSEPVSARVTG
ncbi:MAG: TRAP transporter fused permease subunit [Candidatus Rokubacteria bacterium]|nr:TRAP transporter fused permease subunit [Candidatus Rokubacteria bacterium]